jgi:hypothetical protein
MVTTIFTPVLLRRLWQLKRCVPIVSCVLLMNAHAKEVVCPEFSSSAMMPKDLSKALYLAASNEPWAFQEMVCTAIQQGAKVRYLRSGLFRNEGFEVRGSIVVRAYFERSKVLSTGQLLLIPTDDVVSDKEIEITSSNLRTFTGYLIAASRGQ